MPAERRYTHVVVCGFSRSGTTLLYNMLRGSAVDADCPPQEASVAAYKKPASRNRITKRPLDIFRLSEAQTYLHDRDLKVVIVVRDPRSLIASFHKRVPEQEMQGFDYCFLVGRDFVSYSNPGIVSTHEAIVSYIQANPEICEVVRFEDLMTDPEAVRSRLQSLTGIEMARPFSAFHDQEIPQKLSVQLNGVRPIEPERSESWKSVHGLERVARQFFLEPALHEILRYWGYERSDDWLDAPQPAPAGNVVLYDPQDPTNLWKARLRTRGPMLGVAGHLQQQRDPWPYLAQYTGDLAIFTSRNGEASSDVVWLNDTHAATAFLDRWVKAATASAEPPDRVLDSVISGIRAQNAAVVQHLPPTMTGADRTEARPSMQPFFECLASSADPR